MDFDESIEDARQAVAEAASADPGSAPFGIMIADRSLGAVEQRYFLWFESLSDLGVFLSAHFGIAFCGVEEAGTDTQSAIESIVDQIAHTGLIETLREAIEATALQWITVPWWGTFDDLCAGSSDVARELIAQFRELSADEFDEDDDAAEARHGEILDDCIESDETEEFVEFLLGLSNQ